MESNTPNRRRDLAQAMLQENVEAIALGGASS
jgi:hypothetical protein